MEGSLAFDIPLAFKTIYVIMDLSFESLSISSFIQDQNLNFNYPAEFLGSHLDWSALNKLSIDYSCSSQWV